MLKNLTVNRSVDIEVKAPGGSKTYKSRVEEVKTGEIVIAMPIKEGRLINLRKDELVKIIFWDDSSIYTFEKPIKSRVSEPIPTFNVDFPEKSDVTRIQRRNFVRVEANVPIEYGQIPNDGTDLSEIKYHKGTSIDISGGGLKFLTKLALNLKDVVHINLWLNENSDPLSLFGKVVRAIPATGENKDGYLSIGVEFLNISNREQDSIIKFVFDWQRTMRKKGLI